MKSIVSIYVYLMMSCSIVFAQQFQIKGQVKDRKGQLLSGITILDLADHHKQVITDEQGKFMMHLQGQKTIEVRGIGYKTQILTVKDSSLMIILEENPLILEEVAITGYSKKKKSELSSAVSVVSAEKLTDLTSMNLGQLLQGKVPGLLSSSSSGDPTAGSTLTIRGKGSINASSTPLYVVDGIVGGSFNPYDVASITVLKDASATGIYGSRASNGVIIVSTKQGQKGVVEINLDATQGWGKAVQGSLKMMDTEQLFKYQQSFFKPDSNMLNQNTNWWDLAFRNAALSNYNLSANGGGEQMRYYIGAGYFKELGTLIGNDKAQYSLRSNLTTFLTPKIQLSALLNGRFINDNYNAVSSLNQAYLNLPYDRPFDDKGLAINPKQYGDWYGRDRNNFMFSFPYNYSRARSSEGNLDLNLEIEVLKHLNFASFNRINLYHYEKAIYNDRRTPEGFNADGYAEQNRNFSRTLTSSNRLNYLWNKDVHHVNALLVGEVEQNYTEKSSSNILNLPPGFDAFSTGTGIGTNPSGSYENHQYIKYLLQLDYNFKERYFLNSAVVNEYASKFGANNPSSTFFQIGSSWILSQEHFWKWPSIDFFKLRTSYGTTGNAAGISSYAALGLYSISAESSYAGTPGANPIQQANPNLTWEKSKVFNLGVELSLFKRIHLSIDYYHKTTKDLLFKRTLPASSEFIYIYENVGKIKNRGLEISLLSQNISKDNFHWETELNLAFNRNKVTELSTGSTMVDAASNQPIAIGHEMNEWYLPQWAGVNPDNGKPLWIKQEQDAAGNIKEVFTEKYNEATRVFTGKSSTPTFSGGISNRLSYKNFDLNFFINVVQGNYIYHTSRFYFDNDGLYESYNQMQLLKGWSRWEKPGDIATHPKPVFGRSDASNQTSTRYLEDGSYIRLRNVSFSFNFPHSWLNKWIKDAKITLSADNLLTITKFSGADPQVNFYEGSSSIPYPSSKKYLLSLHLKF